MALTVKALPWLDIWTRPRAVLLRVRNLPLTTAALLVVVVGGLGALLDPAWFIPPFMSDVPAQNGVDISSPLGWVRLGVQGALLGLFEVFVLGWVAQVLGRLLGGVGTYRWVVHAFAWPLLVSVQITGVLFVLSYGAKLLFGAAIPGIYVVLWSVLALCLVLWLLVVSVRMLAEAHDYASWRALLTLVLVGLLDIGLITALPTVFLLPSLVPFR